MIHIIKYSAEWCQPCKKYDPILTALDESRDDVTVTRVDVDDVESGGREKARAANISAVPYTVFTTPEGEVLGSFQGAQSLSRLNKVVDALIDGWPQDVVAD